MSAFGGEADIAPNFRDFFEINEIVALRVRAVDERG
jgi:maltooligosyltrehalose synthase